MSFEYECDEWRSAVADMSEMDDTAHPAAWLGMCGSREDARDDR